MPNNLLSIIRAAVTLALMGTLFGCSGIPYRDAEEMVLNVDRGIERERLGRMIPKSISSDIQSGEAILQESVLQEVPDNYCTDAKCSPSDLSETIRENQRNSEKLDVSEILYIRYPTVCLSISFIFDKSGLIGTRLFKNTSLICD